MPSRVAFDPFSVNLVGVSFCPMLEMFEDTRFPCVIAHEMCDPFFLTL